MRSEEFILAHPIFTTREFANSVNIRADSASRKLNSLAKDKAIIRGTKGLWFNDKHPNFSPLLLVPYILGKEQGYVSFLSALNYHGVLSQIPQKILIATTGHARAVKIDSLQFELIQIKPEFMRHGIEWREYFALASPEKALLDCLYLSSRKGKRFYHLPELSLIKKAKLKALLKQHNFPESIKNYILKRMEELL